MISSLNDLSARVVWVITWLFSSLRATPFHPGCVLGMSTCAQSNDAVTSGAGTPGFQAGGVSSSQISNTGNEAQGSIGNLPSGHPDPERRQTPPSSTPKSPTVSPSPAIDLSVGVYPWPRTVGSASYMDTVRRSDGYYCLIVRNLAGINGRQ